MNPGGFNNRRLALSISGGIDALIGAVILLIGLRLLPIDLADYGLPNWLAIAIGGLMFLGGLAMLIYNLSRLTE